MRNLRVEVLEISRIGGLAEFGSIEKDKDYLEDVYKISFGDSEEK
jgi:hypothetical protein